MKRPNRRQFLRASAMGAAALGISLWIPKRARGATPAGSVRRVVIINLGGGARWNASFDADPSIAINPWGVATWGRLNTTSAPPQWGFGRMLVQRPVDQGTTGWQTNILPYLQSDDHFLVQRPALSTWQGAPVPTIADIASDIAVIRVHQNPGGPASLDHAAASAFLHTGKYSNADAGIATSIYDGLKRQQGANLDAYYQLPPIAMDSGAAFCTGTGDFAGSRGISLGTAQQLPTSNPAASVSQWGRAAEVRLDQAFAAGRPTFVSQKVQNLMNDKHSAEKYGAQLLSRALHLEDPNQALGHLAGGSTPVTNAMLAELFAISSSLTPLGDPLRAAYASQGRTSWTTDWMGYNAAFAVRALQMGAPIVAFGLQDGLFDTHGGEVVGDSRGSHGFHIVRVARALSALNFALRKISDPQDPSGTASLWDSTVVMVCSEFGRPSGFNISTGANGGGSDHAAASAMPIMGGPVAAAGAAGTLIADPAIDGGFYHQNRVWNTLKMGMGIATENNAYLSYADFPPIGGIVGGV